jgi:hypothetical protein
MNAVWEVISFRRMVSPMILQVLFWGGIGGTLYGTYLLISIGHWAWPFPLVFGTLAVRVIFETAILAFRSYDRLGEIRDALKDR